MGRVLLPEGTAPSAHIPGIDNRGQDRIGSDGVAGVARQHTKNDDFAQNGCLLGLRRVGIRKLSS